MTKKRKKTEFDPCWLTPLMFARDSNFAKMRLNKNTASREIFNSMKRLGEHGPLMTMMMDIRDKAHVILKSKKLPITFEELKTLSRTELDALPVEVKHVYEMLNRFYIVQEKVKENDAAEAAWHMGKAMLSAMRSEITPVEPIVEHWQKFGKVQSEKARKPRARNNITPAQRWERNEKIIRAFKKSPLNPSSFSQKNAPKYGLQPRQIRHILKKALGS